MAFTPRIFVKLVRSSSTGEWTLQQRMVTDPTEEVAAYYDGFRPGTPLAPSKSLAEQVAELRELVESGGGGGGSADLGTVDAVVRYNTATSSYPARSSATSDPNRRVRWVGPVEPTIGGAYATNGLDVWEVTS